MPNVFGRQVQTVDEIVEAFRLHGDRVRGTYRARYSWDRQARDPYAGTTLERPTSLRENPPDVLFPWEQIFVAAAACAGSDYPMLAAHQRVALERVEFVVEGVFDPRHEFDGLGGFVAPPEAHHCYASLLLRTMLVSPAARDALEALHARVLAHNMVLDALRGVPQASELTIAAVSA